MQRLPVEYRTDAVEDIERLFDDVLQASSDAVTAARFTDRVFERCEKIGDAPFGGVSLRLLTNFEWNCLARVATHSPSSSPSWRGSSDPASAGSKGPFRSRT